MTSPLKSRALAAPVKSFKCAMAAGADAGEASFGPLEVLISRPYRMRARDTVSFSFKSGKIF